SFRTPSRGLRGSAAAWVTRRRRPCDEPAAGAVSSKMVNVPLVALSALAALSAAAVASASSPPLVGGSGIVVAYSAQDVRFCNGPMTLALTPGPPRCRDAIRVTGVDLSRLEDRVSRHGKTWGRAYLMGTFCHGILTVVRQA